MIEFKADMHCHSLFSDGTDTPQRLLQLALEKELSGLAITDHDTIEVYQTENLWQLAKESNLLVLNGVEFSALYKTEPVHILGYGYALDSEAIIGLCRWHKQRRERRSEQMVEKLRQLGLPLDLSQMTDKEGTIGRPHIAKALVTNGFVASIQEAFDRYLGEGKPAYDPGESISVEETIDTIHKGQGKAVLAHPHLIRKSSILRAVLQMAFDGIECYYARLPANQCKRWLEMATQKNWWVTGGSDYHGWAKPDNFLGSSWVGRELFFRFYEHFLLTNSL